MPRMLQINAKYYDEIINIFREKFINEIEVQNNSSFGNANYSLLIDGQIRASSKRKRDMYNAVLGLIVAPEYYIIDFKLEQRNDK